MSQNFDGLLSAFEELDVPLFLHPGIPPKPAWDTYFKFDSNLLLSATLEHGEQIECCLQTIIRL
jgi:hypothetical protein